MITKKLLKTKSKFFFFSSIKKKSFMIDSFFLHDGESFFRTNTLPQTIGDYFSIIEAITHLSMTEKGVSLFLDKELLKHLQMLQSVHTIFLLLKRRLKSLISFVDEQNLFSQSCPSQMNRLVLHFARKMHLQCTADKPHLLFIHFYLSMPFLIIVIFYDYCFII